MNTNKPFWVSPKQNLYYSRQLFIALLTTLFIGCVPAKKIVYFEYDEEQDLQKNFVNYQPKIQIGDILNINVSSITPEAAIPFNLFETQGNTSIPRPLPYIVNADGEINFPAIGKFKIEGLTTKQITEELHKGLLPYLNNPIVNVRISNFRISVLGEVRSPGSYQVLNERISIFDAIGLAGDLNIQGERKLVTLVREQNGERFFIPLDLTDRKIFDSPYFYLAQNDIIYVRPNKARINSSGIGSNTTVILTGLSILISVAAILIR